MNTTCQRCDIGTYELYPFLSDEVEWGGETWSKDDPAWENVWAVMHELKLDRNTSEIVDYYFEGKLISGSARVPGNVHCTNCAHAPTQELNLKILGDSDAL